MARISRILKRWVALLEWEKSPFLLLVRLVFGIQFAQSGWGKLHNLDGVTAFFTELKIPMPGVNAVVVSVHELFGGALIAVGLGGRVVPIPLIFMMLVAYATSDYEAVQKTSLWDTGPFTEAAPFLFLMTFLLVLIVGPGALSVDGILVRFLEPEKKKKG